MKSLLCVLFALVFSMSAASARVDATVEYECININIEKHIESHVDAEKLERLGELKTHILDFFHAGGERSIPAVITMETAENLIDYLRFKGFQVSAKIEYGESYWWKYPLMGLTGLAGGSLFTYYVLRVASNFVCPRLASTIFLTSKTALLQ